MGFEPTTYLLHSAAGALPLSSMYEHCGEYTQCSYPTRVHVQLYACATTDVNMPTRCSCIIGERERANLVVQLAQFFYIYICIYICNDGTVAHTVMFYVSSNFTCPIFPAKEMLVCFNELT